MIMFLRRIYYDLITGEIIDSYFAVGLESVLPIENDFENHIQLSGRTLENTGFFEWTEPDEEIESKMTVRYELSIDVSKTPHELVFTENIEPTVTNSATVDDYERALQELGV